MKISDKNKFRQQLFDLYCAKFTDYELHDPQLIDEALAVLEQSFGYMEEDKVLKCSRPYAISYLALRVAKELIYEK